MRVLAFMVLLAAMLPGQYVRRGAYPAPPGTPGAYKGVAVTFHGKLKSVDKKALVIETDEDQTVSIRITGKTKFLKNDKTIKPSEIDLDTLVSVDATEDADLSVIALDVMVDLPQRKKSAEK